MAFTAKKRDLPQPRTYTCIFSRCRLTHPSCEAACEVPGHTQPPPAVAALAISSLCWAGNCYYFPLYQLHLLPARSLEQCVHLGGQMWCPQFGRRDAHGVQSHCECCPRSWCCPRPESPRAVGCGVFNFAFSGAGQGRQTALIVTLQLRFPKHGSFFPVWFLSFVSFFSPSRSKRPNNNNCFFFPWFWMEPLVQPPLRDRSLGSCPSHPLSRAALPLSLSLETALLPSML